MVRANAGRKCSCDIGCVRAKGVRPAIRKVSLRGRRLISGKRVNSAASAAVKMSGVYGDVWFRCGTRGRTASFKSPRRAGQYGSIQCATIMMTYVMPIKF